MPKVKRITFKEKEFAKAYVRNRGNGTQAALEVYDTKDPNTASQIATDNLDKTRVLETIEQIASTKGISSSSILDSFNELASTHPEKVTAEAKLKATIELAKILRLYPDKKSTHVRLDVKGKIKEMDYNQAKKEYESLSYNTKDFLNEAD